MPLKSTNMEEFLTNVLWLLLGLIQNINLRRCSFTGNTWLSIQNKSEPQNKTHKT